jgi:hypothetical protein
MERERPGNAGAPEKAPLPGQSSLGLLPFAAARNNPVEIHETLRLTSPDFQTCRKADSPKSAGREAALEAGLEICAARRDAASLTILVYHSLLPAIGGSR